MRRTRERKRNFGFLVALACLGLATAGNAVAADTFDGTYTGPRRVIRDNNSAGCVVHLSLQKFSLGENFIWFSVHPDQCAQMGWRTGLV